MSVLHLVPSVAPASNASTVEQSRCDIDFLHGISLALIGEQDLNALHRKIVDAAVAITGSQFGTMQQLCPEGHVSGHGGELQLLCSHGLPADAVGFWQWVSPAAYSSCTMALKLGERAIIPDFEQWTDISGTEDLMAFRRAGIRSAQTTPLRSRTGQLLGMISTHWTHPHQPSARDLRLLDILARQAADLLERTIAEDALRAREQELARTVNLLREAEEQQARVQAELLNLNETLEQRIAERTALLMQSEEQLRQSQKMEAVGQLTGGLAHDFNNLLAGISSALELMNRRIEQGRVTEVGKYMAAAQGAASRAASLTHRLLAFSRRQTLEPRATNVNALMYGMAELIQRTAGPTVILETRAAEEAWPIHVDASQLENTLLNLCINSRDAMPDGGRITLETSNQWLDRTAARAHNVPEGPYLCLSVTDTGTGMSPEVMGRVFEPFFTTKPLGQGTGLGLSMIYGFVQQSGGQIHIRSALGEGTCVSIYLPRYQGIPLNAEAMPDLSTQSTAQHCETILLVDDESTVRMLLADYLGELGYTVIQAADSLEGLRLLRSGAHIDLLLTDVGLPGGMNGRQMAEAGMDLRPQLKVLFITGYAENSAISDGELPCGMQVMTKPFVLDSLENRIREILTV
ncbi:GAF domain-containing hybrid sensor histidine kinase/response regulator [Pseudomonas vanderleydeniana]|uniref:histidine kinase n=1 Tax=Pseudomonas vanderleydeniana TaxID=2745495 RepID=A0A9E6PHD9_9PSED|nr:ATP-binding protein [Pseudomonas vanderleydeniana]QXI26462.1 response regulator [Pseudomonas vanderleydeniana]